MRIKDRKEIVLEKLADPLPDSSQETNEKLFNQMREDVVELGEPCYILFDIWFQCSTGFMKDVVGYIYWCPDDISPWDKMMYACSNNKLKSEFKGVKSFEYHDTGEFNFQEMVKDLIRKDRQWLHSVMAHSVFFKFLSRQSFVKSRRLWVHLLHISWLVKQWK